METMVWDLEPLLFLMSFHIGITTPAHSGGKKNKVIFEQTILH